MKFIIFCLFFAFYFLLATSYSFAVYDPLSVPNNRVGVHILSPDEITDAAKLVNNEEKGSWGYVTIPIQATDRNREKWTVFMEKCQQLKIIPIIRVATLGDGPIWLKPQDSDLIDFANFLNDLPWPTQNRYVVIFNEVNRANEYGGAVSPENYADILNNAIDIFKRLSDKFFILPSAMDNAAPDGGNFMRWDIYLSKMHAKRPEVFEKIDGWNSHSYGNPGFSSSPALSGYNKSDSFKFDLALVNRFTQRKLPVFITEAGWSNAGLDDRTIATFYNHAFYNLWSNDQVVAVTPFILFAGAPPFDNFSLLNKNHQPTLAYQTIQTYATAGEPPLEVYPTPTPDTPSPTSMETIPSEAPPPPVMSPSTQNLWQKIVNYITKIIHLSRFSKTINVGPMTYQAEIVSTQSDLEVGLAKYNKLEENQAMYFDLKTKAIQTFWMKDMKFDIDIIWIDDDLVVGVSQGYFKDPYALIQSPAPANFVLEVNPNSGIKPGDKVTIINP
jgi:hypothetical protein